MAEHITDSRYMPLGSIGSGSLGIDGSGLFYNDILHPMGQGPLLPNTFPVLRVSAGKGDPYIRTLCCGKKGEGPVPEPLQPEEYNQQVAFPILSCQQKEGKLPIRVTWTYFSPLAPYDHVASVIPAVLFGVRVVNAATVPLQCSLMFCMDNIAVEPGEGDEKKPAQIHFVRVEPTTNDTRSHMGTSLFRGAVADAPADLLKTYVRNAVLFGDRRNTGADAVPHVCLGAREQLDAKVFLGVWNPDVPASTEQFWKVFREKGVPAPSKPGTQAKAAGVCSATVVPPGKTYRFDFILAWHVPPKVCERMGNVNHAMQHFPNAPESVRYGLRHLNYLYSAVSNWQQQLTGSALPAPFTESLIDSCRGLVTHTQHEEKNGFVLKVRLDDAWGPEGDWDFLNAFSLLSFEPRFHASAITTVLPILKQEARDPKRQSSLVFLRRCAEVVLSAFSDVLYTGNRARFREWYPRITELLLDSGVATTLEKAANSESKGDALPVLIMGLWAAAMNAIAVMAREQGDNNAQQYESLRQTLANAYGRALARMAENAAGTMPTERVQALAGACCSELLHLDPLASARRVHALLPDGFAALAGENAESDVMRQTRNYAAIASALFIKDTPAKQPVGTMDKLLTDLVKMDPDSAISDRELGPNRLALWTVLQSLSGVYYDSLHHSLTIRPSAQVPLGATLPVFTPVSLGKIDLQEEKGQEHVLIVRIALETPLTVESILLRLPVAMRSVRAACVHEEEMVTASQELLPGDGDTRIALRFRTPLKLTGMLTLRLRETGGQHSV